MENIHYVDGQWVETSKAHISAFDLSLLRGFGIFDYLRTYNRKPFTLDLHIDRLFRSAKLLGMSVPKTKKEIHTLVQEGVRRNPDAKELHIRLLVTGGMGPDSLTPGKPSLLLQFTPLTEYPRDLYEKGVKIVTYRSKRIIPNAKSINYLLSIVALQDAKKEGAIEVVYVDDSGLIYEGTTSNIFFVSGKKLVTPKTDVLVGITRTLLIDIAKKLHIKLEERDVDISELPRFDEAFLTASNKEIMPIVKIDKTKVGSGKVGDITKKLRVEYEKLKGKL